MFVVQIDYVVDVELNCYVLGYMLWWKFGINLVWFGFVDVYFDIVYYFINIGLIFMGVDFNVVK